MYIFHQVLFAVLTFISGTGVAVVPLAVFYRGAGPDRPCDKSQWYWSLDGPCWQGLVNVDSPMNW